MMPLFDHVSIRITRSKTAPTTMLITCSLFLIALEVDSAIGGLNNVLYTIVNAQLEDVEELREEQRAEAVEELEAGLDQDQDDQSIAAPNGLSLKLDQAHFIPLSPLSDSPGNQVKMLLDYNVQESSSLLDGTVNAVMEVYAANQTLLRTSSLPEPIILDDLEGTIQLATTFDDPTLKDVTTRALLTDGEKMNPISDPLETTISLGEVKAGN